MVTKNKKPFDKGIRIYNLFPRIVGPMHLWKKHAENAAKMGFNWIYVNPFHYPGFSGSLYAPKDYYRFNPLFLSSEKADGWEELKSFIDDTKKMGLKLMMDLVINHTAIDSDLTKIHPEWYKRDSNGKIVSPSAIDPADARNVTVWGDLGEIDNENSSDKNALWQYWKELLTKYIKTGFEGFRCDAAYQVPESLWIKLIGGAKKKNKTLLFLAETLGCSEEALVPIARSGFDYIYNSSKWWDFESDWCLNQYNMTRKFAPSISFPETHDTPRLAEEYNGNEQILKQRYLFSAIFSKGLFMPMGYEYGFRKRMNVLHSMPSDWENIHCDLRGFIKSVNKIKKTYKIFNEECFQELIQLNNTAILALEKVSQDNNQKCLILLNKDNNSSQSCTVEDFSGVICSPGVQKLSFDNGKEQIEYLSTNQPYEFNLKPSEIIIVLSSA
ncbi:MAG: alpha-amylase family glycosyl hydrolase [Candidatus Theseobacter exili]|nr:alpha-amylase family glycosyl hydrolase [Candidatus Theseobacter exili]